VTKLKDLPQIHYHSLDSTNSKLKQLATDGAPHLTVVTADFQSAGRGRQGREWHAPAGTSLLLSLLWRETHSLASIAAGVAVSKAIKQFLPESQKISIKWPNDVLIDGKKVCGVLVEGRPDESWIVVGVGINTSLEVTQLPSQIATNSASMSLAKSELSKFKAVVVKELVSSLCDPVDKTLNSFRAQDALKGQTVIHNGSSGIADGVTANGNLVLLDKLGNKQELQAGEVHLAN